MREFLRRVRCYPTPRFLAMTACWLRLRKMRLSFLSRATVITVRLLIFVSCAGCATFHPQPLSSSQITSAFEARTLHNPELKAFLGANLHQECVPWPPQSWDLTTLTLVALYYHPDLDVARATADVAEAGVVTARGRPNPSIEIAPGYASNAAPGITPWLLHSPFDIPIETAGKRGYRITQATHLSEAARFTITTTAWQVRSRVRKRLLDVYAATQTEALLHSQQAVREEIVTFMEQRLAAGEISRPELTLVRLALEQTRLAVHDVQKQRAEARAQLAEALGLPVDALAGAVLNFEAFEHLPAALPTHEGWRQALLNRPDLLAALAEYAASESDLQLEIAKQYPDFHLNPNYERDTEENKWFLGLSLELPVLDRNEGPIAEAEARRQETAARVRSLQAGIMGEIDRARAGYETAQQKLATADAFLSAHARQQQSLRALLTAGEADRLDFLAAQLEFDVSARARLDALVTAQQSFGLFEDAIQRPLSPPGPVLVTPEVRPPAREEHTQ
jgi:outer membrane protein, heavy metal efflux system